jgi:hypothetical protein
VDEKESVMISRKMKEGRIDKNDIGGKDDCGEMIMRLNERSVLESEG